MRCKLTPRPGNEMQAKTIDKRVYRDWKREGQCNLRRVNNLSALMIERGQFSAVYLFIFLAKNMRIKKMTSLDYNN